MAEIEKELFGAGIDTSGTFSKSNGLWSAIGNPYAYQPFGESAINGYIAGINERADAAAEAFRNMVQGGMKATAEEQDSHSPSKEYMKIGKDAVDGYNLGISQNTNLTITTVEEYINKVITAFSGIIEQMTTIGCQAMQGFSSGMDGMSGEIVKKAQDIADSVSETFRKALDIHSPSRVMFGLGQYTMEGYRLGVESIRANLEKSFGGYTANTIDMFSSSIDYAAINAAGKQKAVHDEYYAEFNSQNDMRETNMLLRELVTAVREGKTIEIDGEPVFRVTRKKAGEFFERTGHSPYPV